MMPRRHVLPLFLLALLFSVSAAAETPAGGLDAVLASLEGDPPASVYGAAREMADSGDALADALRDRWEALSPRARIAAGYGLLLAGEQREGAERLAAVVADAELDLPLRLMAADALGAEGGAYAGARIRSLLREDGLPDRLRVRLADSLWRLTHAAEAYEVVRTVLASGSDAVARDEAVLALARFGQYEEVLGRLEALAQQPGPRGDQARILLELKRTLDRELASDSYPARVIGEVVEILRERYTPDVQDEDEQRQLTPEALATEAARAMVNSVDPFNDYLDEESYKSFMDQIGPGYGGIGAYVGMKDGRFTILQPMYGKPAFEAGLRSMDVVEKIDGVEIKEMDLREIVNMLKGRPGTDVTVSVWRRGWQQPQEFVITRRAIVIDSVIAQRLPGNIGYIHITAFTEHTPEEMEKALKRMKRDKVAGVILDLSNNPGGLLPTAINVVKQFVGGGKLVLYTEGKQEPRVDYFAGRGRALYTGPLVIMINEGSASASEIVAGALRDHDRALLVGQKSFGKGSVQRLLGLRSTRGRTRLKLTVANYYLPSGQSIHKKGIEPGVKVEEPNLPMYEVEARYRFREGRDIDRWVEAMWPEHEATFRRLLAFDKLEPEAYPGLGKLTGELHEKYPKLRFDEDVVRREVRSAIRRYLRDRLGDDRPADVEENTTLQRALVELARHIPDGLPDTPLYKWVAEQVAERKAAALAKAEGAETVPSVTGKEPPVEEPTTLKAGAEGEPRD